MKHPPLVVAVHGHEDSIIWVEDGRGWYLCDSRWEPLVWGPGIGGHVLTRDQVEELTRQVGRPTDAPREVLCAD